MRQSMLLSRLEFVALMLQLFLCTYDRPGLVWDPAELIQVRQYCVDIVFMCGDSKLTANHGATNAQVLVGRFSFMSW